MGVAVSVTSYRKLLLLLVRILNQQKSREDNTWISNSSLQDISALLRVA
jgi:hypothetical protein